MTALLWVVILARIIAGEAPGCPMEAKIAVAHVWYNRIEAGIEGGWFGDRDPTAEDLIAAATFLRYDDPTDGALYMLGPGDLEKVPWAGEETGHWTCDGTSLTSYR